MSPRFLTIAELTTRLGIDELAQIAGIGSFNDPDGRTLDEPKIEEAIAFSEDLLIGYARTRYGLIETLTPEATPDLVKGLITDVSRYRLRSRSGGQGQISTDVLKRYEDALSFFRAVAGGRAELPIGGLPIDGDAAGTVMAEIAPSRIPGILQGWLP